MRKMIFSKALALLIAVLMLTMAVGCGSSPAKEENGTTVTETNTIQASTEKELPMLEYSMIYGGGNNSVIEKAANNPNDIITPYLEEKFKIKAKEVRTTNEGQSMKDAFALFTAAGNVPDVIEASQMEVKYLVSTGEFADLTDYLTDMPNYTRYLSQDLWPRWSTNGKHSILPMVQVDANDPQFASNPYVSGNAGWCMWMREDILTKLGYKFTPMAEISKLTTDKGILPTMEDFKIEPAIDTPAKFFDLMKKIKDLNLKVGDKKVIPFSSAAWSVFHISTMFDNGHWRINDKGEVDGWLGLPGAKDFYKTWAQMYRENIIDKDYVTQKDDQLQSKAASGLVAAGLYLPDFNAARQANIQRDPAADLRYIPWPKENQDLGYFDVFENGFMGVVINKNFKDTKRLLQYFDWMNSDEGQDILSWGPESAGLWEMKDGKKQFKAEVADDIINNKADGKNASYYGIYDPFNPLIMYNNRASVAGLYISAQMKDWRLSYPVKLNLYDVTPKVFSKYTNTGLDFNGVASYGDGGDNTNAVNSWFWNKFVNLEIGKLLVAKTDTDFDKVWDAVQEKLKKEGKYDAAKADMIKWFQEFGPKK